MKIEQKDTKSLEKYYPAILQVITYSENQVVSRDEIESHMVKNSLCSKRLVTDILKALVTRETLVREKIRGKKRLGYTINEEIISKMNESFVTTGVTKKGLPIHDKITQKELSQEMKGVIRRYKKNIGNKKSEVNNNLELFFVIHTYFLTLCLGWIARLTLSIHGGVFHQKTNKIFLARKNIEMLQGFIGLMLLKVQEKNPDNYDLFLTSMHNFFEYLDPFAGSKWSRETMKAEKLIDKALPPDD
jgi:hypothetical protein